MTTVSYETGLQVQQINIATYKGAIPAGKDLVVFEAGDIDSAIILYGFDEAGMFDKDFEAPVYGFMDSI